MKIEPLSFPSKEQQAEIGVLINLCADHDGIDYEIDYDESFRKAGEFNTLLLRREDGPLKDAYTGHDRQPEPIRNGELVAMINLFTPGRVEGELSAFTHPDFRNQGCFRRLADAARAELARRDYKEMLFVIPGASSSGKAAVERLGGVFSHSEYLMRLEASDSGMDFEPGLESVSSLEADPGMAAAPTASTAPPEIRPAAQEDRPALLGLAGISFGESPEDGERYLEGTFSVPGRSIHLALLEGEAVGMVSMVRGESRSYIHGLCVLPRYRKQGIGGALLRYKIAEARSSDPEKPVELEVATENPGALALYERAGFRVAKRFDYYRMEIGDWRLII